MKVWTLDDGVPGHWSMTEGLIRLIRRHRTVEETRIRVEWRWGAARQLSQRCERLGVKLPLWWVRALVRFEPEPPAGRPDLIVSRGGATLFLNAWLARREGAANVFIGKLRRMPESLYRAVLLYQDDRRGAPYFPLPLFPTRIDQDRLEASAEAFSWTGVKPKPGDTAALFLGGDGSGYNYSSADWRRLAEGAAKIYSEQGVRWCVASSRRTPPEAEGFFRELLPAAALIETCWWHAGDRRACMEAFLAVAHTAFCTEDSMSMIEECIASGRPVVSIGLPHAKPNDFFREFIAQRVDARRLRQVQIDGFSSINAKPEHGGWNLIQGDSMSEAAGRLLERLKL